MDCSTPGFSVYHQLPELAQIYFNEFVMPSNHLILCHSLLLLPSIFSSIGVFPMSWLFAWGGQSVGVSALASVLSMNIQDWFPFGLTGLKSFQFKGLSRVFSNTTVQKHPFFSSQLSLSYYTPKDVLLYSKFAPLSTKSPFKSSEFRPNIPTIRIIVLDQISFQ